MSNFWSLNDGTTAESSTSFDAGGDFELIPNNTALAAAIEEATWKEYEGDSYINLKWRVMRPEKYANRILFHKLKVFGMASDKDKAAVADKAKRMLAAIDANCGGKLAKLKDVPQDMDLMTALVGKPMGIKVQVWEIKEENKSGNWISAVSPLKSQAPAQNQAPQRAPQPQQRPAPKAAPVSPAYDDLDDSIPF